MLILHVPSYHDQPTHSILLAETNDNSLNASFIALIPLVYPFSVLLRVQNAHFTCAKLPGPALTLHSIGTDQSKSPQSMICSLFSTCIAILSIVTGAKCSFCKCKATKTNQHTPFYWQRPMEIPSMHHL